MRVAFAWIVLCALAVANGATPDVRATLGHARLFIGESTELHLVVSDVDVEPTVDTSALTQFDVKKLGAQQFSNSMVRIVNGQVSQSEQRGYEIVFRLTPREAGILRIPSLPVTIQGETIQSGALAIRVDPPTPTELAYVAIDLIEAPKYPMQRTVVRLRVFLKRLPGEFAKVDPLRGAARLQIDCPFIDVPVGWRAREDVREWLGPKAQVGFRGTDGFEINGYAPATTPQALFGGGAPLFALDGRPATEQDVAKLPALVGRHADYYVYELTRAFEPRRPGRVRLAPPALKGGVCAKVQRDEPQRELVYVVGDALEIDVPELPSDGRPSSFVGAIGDGFEIQCAVEPRRCRVGDPVTYTWTLRGQGNLEEVEPPQFSAVPGFSDLFAVETPIAEDAKGSRVIKATLRPRVAGEIEVPPIPFAYFDTKQERYLELEAKPVALTVEAVETLGAGSITSGAAVPTNPTAITRAAGAYPDVDEFGHVHDDRFPKRAYVACAGTMPVAWLVVALLARRRRAHAQDPHRLRRRNAAEIARARIRGAATAPGEVALAHAREALCGLVAAAAGASESALASKDVQRVLERVGVDAALVQALTDWFIRHDGARFGGAQAAEAMVDEARALVDRLIPALTALRRIGT